MKFFSLKNLLKQLKHSRATYHYQRYLCLVLTIFSITIFTNQLFAEEVIQQGSTYSMAIQKYVRGERAEALRILQAGESQDPESITTKALQLKELIIRQGGAANDLSVGRPEETSLILGVEADMYFHMAFRRYIEGDFEAAHNFLNKYLSDYPHSQKAIRFLQIVQKRQDGFLDESSTFAADLLESELGNSILTESNEDDLYSVNFRNEPLADALYTLSELYGTNIIANQNIDVVITARLRGANLEEALNTMLNSVGLGYIREDGIIRVIDKEVHKTTRIFDLKNISLVNDTVHTDDSGIVKEDLITKIKAIVSDDGKVLYDQMRRTLMVRDTLSVIEDIQKILDHVDVFEPQILIETRIVQVTPTLVEKIGIDWSILDEYSVTLSNPSFSYTGTETRTSTPAVDLDSTDTNGTVSTVRVDKLDQSVAYSLTKALSASISPANFRLILSALNTDTDTKLIASPNLLTRAGEEAHLSIGDQQPIPQYTFNAETGNLEISGFEFKDIGVVLTVIAYPTEDDYVSMVVLPEVSKKTNQSITFGGATATTIPIISSTKVKTQNFVKSGHTLAIGGLIREDVTITEKKVPILGDLPIINKLFNHKNTDISRKNVIIFLTPTIVTKENMDLVTSIQSQALDEEYQIPLPKDEAESLWGNISK
ncbi:MAG: type II secretory pathway component GspD/PulD (secretin) [Candidatus Omnitrophota bacterium]|jgi:type II secretory pathway component GspD/PulD (secretin)